MLQWLQKKQQYDCGEKRLNKKFENMLHEINNEELHIIDKLSLIVDFIRPENISQIEQTKVAIDYLIEFFQKKDEFAQKICNEVNLLFVDAKISKNLVNLGILSANGFSYEISKRFYNKFLPKPPTKGDFGYIISTLFNHDDDCLWVNLIENQKWVELFGAIFVSNVHTTKIKNHLFVEILYSAEVLSIQLAAKEMDEHFIRLDPSFLDDDSAFIALQREIADFIYSIQKETVNLDETSIDFKHIDVLIEQCFDQIALLKKRSINKGISVHLTYELERLTQIITRIKEIVYLIKNFDTKEFYETLIKLFKDTVTKNATKNSLSEMYGKSISIIAKSITNNTSEHGEHYIVDSSYKYLKMFLSASGAGIIIAFMALFKINIMQQGFSTEMQTLLSSLNYGLGFVLIHLFGFTVATKQPAMTASTFAQAIEKGEKKRANPQKLVDLFFQVSRSQFTAVLGNVTFALLIAIGVSYYIFSFNSVVFDGVEAQYYLEKLQPFPALLYAAIAGVWLFVSGIIAGYFDNRADLLELEKRYYFLPIFKKLFKEERRKKIAMYLHEHHGAIAGNFFFGVLLGITPYIGYMIDLPLDIAHVAFSTAYLGYITMHTDIATFEFVVYFIFVLLIGLVNLTVSFVLALKISLLARDAYFGNLFSFLKLFFKEIKQHPLSLFLPITKKEDDQ